MKINQQQREKDISRIMTSLKVDRKEAEEIWLNDFAIDNGFEGKSELTAEKERTAKQYRGTNTRVVKDTKPYQFKRERKQDEVKEQLVQDLYNGLTQSGLQLEALTIENKERLITFDYGNRSYTVTLTRHNKKGS